MIINYNIDDFFNNFTFILYIFIEKIETTKYKIWSKL